MVNPFAMTKRPHSWHRTRAAYGRRATLALMISLSAVLVAFEWRGDGQRHVVPPELWPEEPDVELPPVIIIERERPAAEPVRKARARSAAVLAGDPLPDVIDAPEPVVDNGPPVDPGLTDPAPGVESRPEPGGDITFPWTGVEQRPYFMDCLKRWPGEVDACTELRIEQHLRRHLKVPRSVKGGLRTTVTFEIDREGHIGRLVCTPAVDPAVEQEVDRVLRMLPQFVPATQSGIPVPVYFRIPLSVQVR